MAVTKGNYSVTGPRCMLKQMDGMRAGRCFDGQSESMQPGGSSQVYPCWGQKWFQFLSFGDGERAVLGSLYNTIPSHSVTQIQKLGHSVIPYMCLGVYGRGDNDELDWDDEGYTTRKQDSGTGADNGESAHTDVSSLSEWVGEGVVTTQCSNAHAVIEWVFVPYVVESQTEDEDESQQEKDRESKTTNESSKVEHQPKEEL
jgi:hypothetical protein